MAESKLLARQLKRGLGLDGPESLEALLAALSQQSDPRLQELGTRLPTFLAMVGEAYAQNERDLTLRSRSLELSSAELSGVNERLRHEAAAQRAVLDALTRTSNELLARSGRPPAGSGADDLLALSSLLAELVEEGEAARRELADKEERFRSLLFNLPGCVYRATVAAKPQLLFLSEGVAELSGRPASEFLEGRANLLDLIHPDDLPAATLEVLDAIKQRRAFVQEYRLLRPDGSVRWVHGRGQAVRDADGHVMYMDGFILDAHEAKLAQQEVARARVQLVDAIEALDAGFAMFDEHERLVICNSRYKQFYPGIAAVMQPGALYQDVLTAYAASVHVDSPDAAKDYVERRLGEFRLGRGVREAQVGDTWLRMDDSRTPQGMTVSLRTDVTAMRRLMNELTQAKDAAEAALRVKSDFLANMSHEIRTPLNGIIGMTELALGTEMSAEQREYLDVVKSSSAALLVIVNDVLDFSKIEAGKMTLERIEFSLPDLLSEVLRPLSIQAQEKGLRLLYRFDTRLSGRAFGDPGRLRQVLNNLLGNALKFTASGEVRLEVTPDPASLHWVNFAVVDTGVGISADQIEHIFGAFAQADSSTTRRFGGTGLGLSICARLVKLMGGWIQVESTLGQGSIFRFSLDLEMATVPAVPVEALRGLKVLLTEAHPLALEWLRGSLAAWGLQVTAAADGVQAELALAQADFDFLLLDADLPLQSGRQLAQRLASRPSLLRRSLLMVSAGGFACAAQDSAALGLPGFLAKPVGPQELKAALLQLLHGEAPNVRVVRAEPGQTLPKRRGLNILLAEDHAVNQALASKLLAKLGHQVTLVVNGVEAVERGQREGYDLILMDMQMPELGGVEATQRIRELEKERGAPRVPIIAMTANVLEGYRERCLDAGMDGYVTKPINTQLLTLEIDRVLDARPAEPSRPPAAEALPDDLDLPEVMERLGGDAALFEELMGMFLADCPERLSDMASALSARDPNALAWAAHSLAGSAANLSAHGLCRLARRMEGAAQEQDWDTALAVLPDLQAALARLAGSRAMVRL